MLGRILKYIMLMVVCFFGCFFMFRCIRDGFVPLGLFIGAALVFITLVFLRKTLSPWRWLAVGIIMAMLFTVYPIFYTVYLSFTNMSGGHLLTKQQSIKRLQAETYTPTNASIYTWTAYAKGENFLLLIQHNSPPAGQWGVETPNNSPPAGAPRNSPPAGQWGVEPYEAFIVKPGETPKPYLTKEVPLSIEGYERLTKADTIRNIQKLGSLEFGEAPQTYKVRSLEELTIALAAYEYDRSTDTITDKRNGTIYKAIRGFWTAPDGSTLSGFMRWLGFANYTRFLGNAGYLKPALKILVWNLCFAFFSVLLSFGIGLAIALLFDKLKGRRLIRSLLIIPYPIPVLVSIMVWRALLNENLGLLSTVIGNLTGFTPRFFTDANWTRVALIIINVYLSYPYFYVLTSGALKAIPTELFEAASIDGANSLTILHKIILPLLMRILMPLVIASFCFNFNNFTLIWGFNAGLPAMPDTIVPMGWTDLLISFIYRLGFNTSNAADYGFSAAITVLLFIFVSVMVFIQTKIQKMRRN